MEFFKIILGGGLRKFIRQGDDEGYLINECKGDRIDNRNLIEEWKTKMTEKNRRHTFIWNRNDFMALNITDYDHIFGIC